MAFKALILTDHTNHSSENSLYALATAMSLHPLTSDLYIASKGNLINTGFFERENNTLFTTKIYNELHFNKTNNPLSLNLTPVDVNEFDLVWLRMPPPLSLKFLSFLHKVFINAVLVNRPLSIYETGSKAFLLNFPTVSPPMRICNSIEDINDFKSLHPIVLKPFREYGGKGIVKIEEDVVSIGNHKISYETFIENLPQGKPLDYLGVKYLMNVTQGDKRIVVVNGQVLGASLRMPAKGSWMCNAAMGGTSHVTDLEREEHQMVETINPLLSEKGIVMYGIDTLVADNGQRVLSEINSTSIGGVIHIAKLHNKPVVNQTIDLIWKYYLEIK